MGKAVIEGLKSETKETEKTETLDEILEHTRESHIIELELSKEATRLALGESSDEYIYNIPRQAEYGQIDCGPMCDKMPRGYCKYRADKAKHVHTLGININGAMVIMNAYMGLEIIPSDPEIKEYTIMENGKLVTKSYWYVSVKGVNSKTETKLTLPFMQPTLKKSGNYYNFDEYGPQIAISKAIRNIVLKLVPGNFQQSWIKDYMEGTKPKDKPKEKITDKPSDNAGEMSVESAIEHLNSIESITYLSNWYNKNSNWINKLKTEDKRKVVDTFNAKKDQLSKPPEDKAMATVEQYESIKALAEKLGYSPDDLDTLCQSMIGSTDIPGMSAENAGLVLAELQKTIEQRKGLLA